jgi:hypothetical protein
MTAEKTAASEMTVGHFVAHMPQVYATPMMIQHMEKGGRRFYCVICRRASSRRHGGESPASRCNADRPHRPRHFSHRQN